MSEKMLTVEVERSFNVIDKQWGSDIYVKMYRSAVTSGLLGKLGPELWSVLCVIASYMDEDGKCFPSQEAIAKGLGCSRQTANKWINSLLEFRWQGNPIIERMKNHQRNGLSCYTILPLSQLAIFDGDVQPLFDVNEDDAKKCDVKQKGRSMSKTVTSDVKELDVAMSNTFDTNYNHSNKNH
ncbi:helix-turn-helix domain-containing protein, partial [Heliobacterium chlorum]